LRPAIKPGRLHIWIPFDCLNGEGIDMHPIWGLARVENIPDAGMRRVTLPELDRDAWIRR
jgi:hypothetical protein